MRAFTGATGQVFVTVPEPAGCSFPIRSPDFRNWFVYRALARHDIIPTRNAFHSILNVLEALAGENSNGHRRPVFRRVGWRTDGIAPPASSTSIQP